MALATPFADPDRADEHCHAATQSLYIAKTDSTGSMTQTWFFEGIPELPAFISENYIKMGGGLRAMLDDPVFPYGGVAR